LSSERNPEIGEGVEVLSDMGFQHPLQDRGLDDHRRAGLFSTPKATSAAISAATLLGQVTQVSRSCRANRNTSASARARSTSVPFFFWMPSCLSCAW
jgi:hypothetical protein